MGLRGLASGPQGAGLRGLASGPQGAGLRGLASGGWPQGSCLQASGGWPQGAGHGASGAGIRASWASGGWPQGLRAGEWRQGELASGSLGAAVPTIPPLVALQHLIITHNASGSEPLTASAGHRQPFLLSDKYMSDLGAGPAGEV
ncbi:unnamed protein product [Arctogadus glacialis]